MKFSIGTILQFGFLLVINCIEGNINEECITTNNLLNDEPTCIDYLDLDFTEIELSDAFYVIDLMGISLRKINIRSASFETLYEVLKKCENYCNMPIEVEITKVTGSTNVIAKKEPFNTLKVHSLILNDTSFYPKSNEVIFELFKNVDHLKNIEINNSRISLKDAKYISNILKDSAKLLESLMFKSVFLNEEISEIIFDSIQYSTKLKYLHFDLNDIKTKTMISINKALISNNSIEKLYFKFYRLAYFSALLLAKGIENSRSLSMITLDNCSMDIDIAILLLDGIRFSNIKNVYLVGKSIIKPYEYDELLLFGSKFLSMIKNRSIKQYKWIENFSIETFTDYIKKQEAEFD